MNCPKCGTPLPADWCGHIGVEEAIAQGQRMLIASEMAADAEITRLRDELADEKERNGLYLATLNNMNAEIARLRRIEEAAREAEERLDTLWTAAASPQEDPERWAQAIYFTLERLRAALEEKP